jgi:hypothetical protein
MLLRFLESFAIGVGNQLLLILIDLVRILIFARLRGFLQNATLAWSDLAQVNMMVKDILQVFRHMI